MEAHRVDDDAVLRRCADGERARGVVAEDADRLGSRLFGHGLAWVAGLQLVVHREGEVDAAPARGLTRLAVVAVLGNDGVAAPSMLQRLAPRLVGLRVAALAAPVVAVEQVDVDGLARRLR